MTINGINPLASSGDEGKDYKKHLPGQSPNQPDRIEINKTDVDGDGEYHTDDLSSEKLQDISYRVELATTRISNNSKNGKPAESNREIIDKLKLLRSLELRNVAQNMDSSNNKGSRIDEVRQKILDGYYDDPNHMADLADILIKEFGLE